MIDFHHLYSEIAGDLQIRILCTYVKMKKIRKAKESRSL